MSTASNIQPHIATEHEPESDLAGPTVTLEESWAYCHYVTKTQAKNFYYGLRLTPEPKRSALYAVYAFMRACDDLVDPPEGAPSPEPPEVARGSTEGGLQSMDVLQQRVLNFRADLDGLLNEGLVPGGAMWPAFAEVVKRYEVDGALLHGMLDGQLSDVQPRQIQTFDQLKTYCYQVASVVGLVCVQVWGHDGSPYVLQMAEYRGYALQLTNILRDVAEDVQIGRVYLPAEDLQRFDMTPENLRNGAKADEAFLALMQFEIERAQGYFESSAELESHLNGECRATCWAMAEIYRGLLGKIAADPGRVLRGRVSLSPMRKSWIALRGLVKR